MKILQVHSKYKKRGGEETVVEEERAVLEKNGHQVVQFLKDNASIDHYSRLEMMRLGFSQRSSKKIVNEFSEVLNIDKPDICHIHNVYPLITPGIFKVCKEQGIPVVQTLHNYKMVCTNALLFRKGEVCEKCLNKNLYNSIKYGCYQDSVVATAILADAIQYHRNRGTWYEEIDQYICLTQFQKGKLISGGMPGNKMSVKPNFVAEPGIKPVDGDSFLFVGRIDDSKGLPHLLHLFKHCDKSTFTVIGESENPSIFDRFPHVDYCGKKDREEVLEYMSKSKAIIFPSNYYEGMPMVILEAFSLGKAVIANDTGAMSSMIEHGVNGFKYKSLDEFVYNVQLLHESDSLAKELGMKAREEYEEHYTIEQGYQNLINLYLQVLKR